MKLRRRRDRRADGSDDVRAEFNSQAFEAGSNRALVQIATADREAQSLAKLGYPAHPSAAYTNEMKMALTRKHPYARTCTHAAWRSGDAATSKQMRAILRGRVCMRNVASLGAHRDQFGRIGNKFAQSCGEILAERSSSINDSGTATTLNHARV